MERKHYIYRLTSPSGRSYIGLTGRSVKDGVNVDREQLERARNAIDRSKQAPAASKGLKKFWEDLKKDPVRYKDYIERRKQTLKATNASKNI